MTILIECEGLQWRGGEGQLHFTLPSGARAVTMGGDAMKRAAFRALLGGIVPPTSAKGFSAGEIRWRGKPGSRLKRRERQRWQREAVVLATDPRTSFLPAMRVERLLREISGEKEAGRWLIPAGLPTAILPWPVRWLSTTWRLRLLFALALARRPALIILDDFANVIAGELWEDILAGWMRETPETIALIATLDTTPLPAGVEQIISLDF